VEREYGASTTPHKNRDKKRQGQGARGRHKSLFVHKQMYLCHFQERKLPLTTRVLGILMTIRYLSSTAIFKKSGGSDTVGFAFFLSSFLSAYKAVLCTMRYYRPEHEGDRLNAFVAGSVAGLTLLLDKNKSRRTALTLYLFTRSIQFGSSYSMKKWAEHREAKRSTQRLALRDAVHSSGKEHALVTKSGWDDVLAKVMSSSAATVLMSLTAAVNIYSCVIEPDAMPKSYWNFLMQHSGLPQKFGPMFQPLLDAFQSQYVTLRELPGGMENIGIPAGITSKDFVSTNISPNIATLYPSNLHHDFQLCALLHPLTPCSGHSMDVIKGEFGRAVKMYGTLNFVSTPHTFAYFIVWLKAAVPVPRSLSDRLTYLSSFLGVQIVTLVFQHKKLTTQPKEVARRYIKSTLRSCLFLTVYVWAAFYTPCVMRRIFKRERTFM
jgi:hypothetical protein